MEPELNKQLALAQQQLSECITARQGLEDDFGRLLVDLFTKEITHLTREVTSEKYRKDLTGYNIALSDLLAYKNILHKLQVAASPLREKRLREKVAEADGQ